MPDDNKTEEFLKKLAPCIERGELEKCVEEAARVAGEMGIGAEELLSLSLKEVSGDRFHFVYVLELAAANGLKEEEKAVRYSNAGIAAQNLKNYENAQKYYEKSIEANPKYAEAYYNYAYLLEELNRKDEAKEHYKKAIEANPNHARAHSKYANLLKEQNRNDEAKEHYKKAIEANPKLAGAHYYYAILLIEMDERDDAWNETKNAFEILKESGRTTYSNLAKAWFYQRYADKNLERKKYKESSEDINKAGEEYIKASETVEGEIKHAFELKGNVCKAQSFIRKEHKTNQELVNDLKNASEFYKKASICPAGGTEETCGACYSVMEVFSQALTALEGVVNNKNPSISKDEWKAKLDKSNEVYLKKGSEKGAALVAALKELIECVDELAYYTARKSSIQKKRLKECYKTLADVSSKVEGGLRNITDPANEVLKNYAKEMGVPMPEEKALNDSPSPFYKKLVKPIVVAIVTIILGYITNLIYEWKTHATIWNFIKSTIFNLSVP